MTPFLFLDVVEGLVGFVRQAVTQNRLRGLKIGMDQTEVSMRQFADDTLVVCQVIN